MQQFFISDLHLSDKRPDLIRAFVCLTDEILAKNTPCELYILGDFFEAYIGDDYQPEWILTLDNQLKQLTEAGITTYFIAGNRDFLVGQDWFDRTGIIELNEQHLLAHNESHLVLTHGDEFCVDDKAYQEFRAMVRQPAWQQQVLAMPLEQRVALAQKLRDDSKTMSADKSQDIMDVNQQAIVQTVSKNTHLLIHGHTHRPALHEDEAVPRLVLGDWDKKIWLAQLSNGRLIQSCIETTKYLAEQTPYSHWLTEHTFAFN